MSGFSSFDGTYRRTPTVSIRGSSKSETREQLLERAQKERQKREVSILTFKWKTTGPGICRQGSWIELLLKYGWSFLQADRTKKAASIKIQSFYRGHIARQNHKGLLRKEFDLIKKSYKRPTTFSTESIETKKNLAVKLLTFFDIKQDGNRIVSNWST